MTHLKAAIDENVKEIERRDSIHGRGRKCRGSGLRMQSKKTYEVKLFTMEVSGANFAFSRHLLGMELNASMVQRKQLCQNTILKIL